jgi:hypothetical protein
MAPGDLVVFPLAAAPARQACWLTGCPDRIVHAYDAAGKVAEGNLASAWSASIAAVFGFRRGVS